MSRQHDGAATANVVLTASQVELQPAAGNAAAKKPASLTRKVSGLSLETQKAKAELANDAELRQRSENRSRTFKVGARYHHTKHSDGQVEVRGS